MAELTDTDLVARLHLPPVRREPESDTAGRDGGYVLVGIGLLFAVAAVLVGLVRRDPGLTWTCVGLAWLGATQLVVGLTLALRGRRLTRSDY